MTDYGYANGWKKVPDKVKKCRELEHALNIIKINRCLNEYTCRICDYTYRVDSGD